MLEGVEAFFSAHEHTIGAIEAFSTFSAVVVSLVLAHRATIANRTQLLATMEISTVMHPTLSPYPRFVTVSIINTGNLPLQVPLGFLRWKVPFTARQGLILPVDSAGVVGVVPQKTYPFEIKPRSSATFYISEVSAFVEQMETVRQQQSRMGRFLFCLKKAVILSSDGRRFRPRGDRGITAAAAQSSVPFVQSPGA